MGDLGFTETFMQVLTLFQPGTIRYSRRVYTNRNLRMSKTVAVGFDMDYTLAIYKTRFDQLAFDLALRRLVDNHGFPSTVLNFTYDPDFAIRGLVVDMSGGNIFKMDRHRHVSRVYHGTRAVDIERRNELYRKRVIHLSNPSFFLVDTLFSLPETHMFALMVDLLDSLGKGTKTQYESAFKSIRSVIDEIHKDGTLKNVVMASLDQYIEKDPDIVATLERFIVSGKKLFLITNSGWEYTNSVLSYLLNDVLPSHPHWTDYFTLAVVEARKPDFFAGRTPLIPEPLAPEHLQSKVFRNGNLKAFQKLLAAPGDRVLYIGDHIYGDILKSKRSSTWRTAMIIPEMETELDGLEAVREDINKYDKLFARRQNLEVQLNYQQRLLHSLMNVESRFRSQGTDGTFRIQDLAAAAERNMASIKKGLNRVEEALVSTEAVIKKPFNPRWGRLFKEGGIHSVFGEQVEQYACTYTSRVSNFLSYSPTHYFRTARDLLPHEQQD